VFEEEIFNLRDAGCLSSFITLTDAGLGGKSTADLRHSHEEGEKEGCLVFEGHFSSEVPPDAPRNVRRLGQASFAFKVPFKLMPPVLRKSFQYPLDCASAHTA
jgi:hypothetical protein